MILHLLSLSYLRIPIALLSISRSHYFYLAVLFIISFVPIINDGVFCGKYDRYIAWSDSPIPSQLCRAHLSIEFFRARDGGDDDQSRELALRQGCPCVQH
ncbi:hypothetical protein K457DRAFT_761306 [Linnemannia elongata AG-77]|uniref:Uncharacterized protein n=1 Tax=Linnemannia elongata AG-77 TaxID=1314771 RepID=A0A197JJR8_9FUNG|nr:hypothetical protein K457DRAFT_761306 [Linnemannia elongata AG-77]